MAKKSEANARLDASGIGYISFALDNPALFRLMFGGGQQQASAEPGLREARERAYGVLQEAVAASSADGVANPLVCLRLWALVHGIATLILEGCIKPEDYGLKAGEALSARLLGRGQ
jgi:Tetracyclin repressor-like, C-terminal domain